MKTNGRYRSIAVAAIAIMIPLSIGTFYSAALAEAAGAPISPSPATAPATPTKGPEVATIGSGPYLGPLAEELLKLAQIEAEAVDSTPSEKEPATATITAMGGNSLTAEERAKLAALPAPLPTLLDLPMPKLELMELPKDGVPELTREELEKRASELASPAAPQSTQESAR